MSSNKSETRDVALKTIEKLLKYTKNHFASEERILQKHHYPNLSWHESLAKKTEEIYEQAQKDLHSIDVDVLKF